MDQAFSKSATGYSPTLCTSAGYFGRSAGNRKANRADLPAALKLRMEVSGKPSKSARKADALSRDHSVRGTMRLSVDSDYPAPAHNIVYNAWPGEDRIAIDFLNYIPVRGTMTRMVRLNIPHSLHF